MKHNLRLFKIAKLAKEKGFKTKTVTTGFTNDYLLGGKNMMINETCILLWMCELQKWLRENYDIHIEILNKSNNLIFKDPYGNFYTADEYLSGNVKKKLLEAEKAFNNGNADMIQNIEKLKLVIPKDIPIHEIEVRMGSRWVPSSIYEKFGKEGCSGYRRSAIF